MWISNAGLYAVVICLLGYLVLGPSFLTYDLYGMGIGVYIALCQSLQGKVAFLHHQWSTPHYIAMAISVFGMLLFLYGLSSVSDSVSGGYYYEATWLFQQALFWFFCFFSIALIAVLIDLVGHSVHLFFFPTSEMLYREAEHGEVLLTYLINAVRRLYLQFHIFIY